MKSYFLLVAFVLAGCAACPKPAEPDTVLVIPPLPVGDGGTENPVEAPTPCGKACANLRAKGCMEGHTAPSGSRCYDVCVNSGKLMQVSCIISANSKEELLDCHVRCLPK